VTTSESTAPSGRFISFEGGEGTGKSTQAKRLAERLREQGIDVVLTREPGGTKGAEIVRRTVLSGRVESLGPFAEALLMNAARDDHLAEVIRPALAAGKWVICDRFADSTRAYQGILGGLETSLINAMEDVIVGETWPDLTIILDIDPEIGLARARAATLEAENTTGDRFEDGKIEDHRRLREAFLAIARQDEGRCVVIDANASEDKVAEAVWAEVSQRLLLQTVGDA
jgi:dTMP kinase